MEVASRNTERHKLTRDAVSRRHTTQGNNQMKGKEAKSGGPAASRCSAWLGRDGECCIPHRLLHEAEQNREPDGRERDSDRNPGANSVWTTEPPLQLSLSEQALPPSWAIIPSGNPLAQLLVRFVAKLVGVTFWLHSVVERPNDQAEARRA